MRTSKATKPTDVYVGKRIRMRRLTLGMSQSVLGDALGLTFQQIQKYEKGVNRVSASRLQQMAKVLQVPVLFFFDGGPDDGDHKQIGDDARDFLATRYGIRIIKAFSKIRSTEVQRGIVGLIEAVVD